MYKAHLLLLYFILHFLLLFFFLISGSFEMHYQEEIYHQVLALQNRKLASIVFKLYLLRNMVVLVKKNT